MTKRTWRWALVRGEAASVMASAPSLRAAAKALGVNLSTIVRWRRAGKIPPPGRRRKVTRAAVANAVLSNTTHGSQLPPSHLSEAVAEAQTPEAWATWARQTFELSGTELALLDLATDAFTLARDPKQSPAIRLNAAGRFQQLVRQLNFEEESDGQTEAPPTGRLWPRRVG